MITVKREDFEILEDDALIWTCIGPTILNIRGRNFSVKSEEYALLNPGQRALLMFRVLYGHSSNGVGELYSHLAYLLVNPGVWSQLKNGVTFFGDDDMAQIIEKMETIYQGQKEGVFEKNAEVSESLNDLNQALRETLPLSVKLVASYIRSHAEEFVQIVDESDDIALALRGE